jgi:glc operon protein GlcG
MHDRDLNLELAQRLVTAAIDVARQQGVNIAASVVDSGGHLVAFGRMDGVGYIAVELTRRKALTACNFQIPNDMLQAIGQSQPAIAADLAKNADICLLGGGLPIQLESRCVGGIGIGGATSEMDRAIAEKAISLLL